MPYDPKRHGPRRIVGPGFHGRVFEVVKRVPEGFVTTYGDVAEALGLHRAARQVGFALAALPPDQADVPWHRVVNGQGKLHSVDGRQHERLADEGIEVREDGKILDFADVRIPVEVLADPTS